MLNRWGGLIHPNPRPLTPSVGPLRVLPGPMGHTCTLARISHPCWAPNHPCFRSDGPKGPKGSKSIKWPKGHGIPRCQELKEPHIPKRLNLWDAKHAGQAQHTCPACQGCLACQAFLACQTWLACLTCLVMPRHAWRSWNAKHVRHAPSGLECLRLGRRNAKCAKDA